MKKTVIEPHKSSLGLDANMLSAILYAVFIVITWFAVLIRYMPFIGGIIANFFGLLSWAAPLAVFILEKNSKFVKVNALYSLFLTLVYSLISGLFSIFRSMLYFITGSGAVSRFIWVISGFVGLIITAVFVWFAFMAYKYQQAEFPGISPLVDKIIEKTVPVKSANPPPENKNDPDNQNNT